MVEVIPIKPAPPKALSGILMNKYLEEIRYPVMASIKIDGIRVLFWHGKAYSKTRKLFPQQVLQNIAQTWSAELHGQECEITIAGMTRPEVGGWCNRKGPAEPTPAGIRFDVFAEVGEPLKYRTSHPVPHFYYVEHTHISNREELSRYVAVIRSHEYEGVMLRGGDHMYKYGKATRKCQRCMKIKFREELIARCVGWEMLQQAKDSLRTRNKHLMGALVFRTAIMDEPIYVGTGFTDKQREEYTNAALIVGKEAEIEYDGIGTDGKPRQPFVFKRWVDDKTA